MNTRSDTLFHFTKSENVLFEILKHGFWPSYCLEDLSWQGKDKTEFVAFPIVCLCDIPLSRITDHIDFYGSYGIGLKRSWAHKNQLNPVLYLGEGNPAANSFVSAVRTAKKQEKEEKGSSAIKDLRFLAAHTKPLSGQMIVSDKTVEKEFYKESEWRHVASHEEVPPYLVQSKYENQDILSDANQKTRENAMLKFLPTDVAYVFVPSDDDIPNVINFMQQELDQYPSADLKVLFSRVISIESILRDL